MEDSNVNNLNGVPNYGHGWPEPLLDNVETDEKVETVVSNEDGDEEEETLEGGRQDVRPEDE